MENISTPAQVQRRRSTADSTLIVMAASAMSVILGFGREVVTAHFYGTQPALDAFLNASIIPTILFGAFNSALIAALVPIFSAYMSAGEVNEATTLGSTVLNGLLVVTSIIVVLGYFAAPLFVPMIAHGFPPEEQAQTITMARWLLPGIMALSAAGVCSALLNANHKFTASAIVWSVANGVTIATIVLFHRQLGIYAVVLGSALGPFVQLCVQLPSIFKYKLYRFAFDVGHPGLARSWAILIPVLVGSGAAQINLAFDRYFASTLHSGSTSALNYTTKLTYLPNQVAVIALTTVAFPIIASDFARGNLAAVRQSISNAIRMVSFVVLPCAIGLIMLAHPIVRALFERGAFTPAATNYCVELIPFACVPLMAISFTTIFGKACYACKQVKKTVLFSSVSVALNVSMSSLLLPFLGARGLLLANGIGGLFLLTCQLALLTRLVKGFEWSSILTSVFKTIASCAAMALALGIAMYFYVDSASLAMRLMFLIALGGTAAVAYLSVAKLLQIEEMDLIFGALRRKLPAGLTRSP